MNRHINFIYKHTVSHFAFVFWKAVLNLSHCSISSVLCISVAACPCKCANGLDQRLSVDSHRSHPSPRLTSPHAVGDQLLLRLCLQLVIPRFPSQHPTGSLPALRCCSPGVWVS